MPTTRQGILYEYCLLKKLPVTYQRFRIMNYDLPLWRKAFLQYYHTVKKNIVAVLLELDFGEAAKGHVSTNLRARDCSQGKTATMQHPTPTSDSNESDSEHSLRQKSMLCLKHPMIVIQTIAKCNPMTTILRTSIVCW
jgi:hypothetical protein